jgi:hypothetical protein
MTIERLEEIFEGDYLAEVEDDVFEGLAILRKYNPYVVQSCEHDKNYSIQVNDSFLEQITEEDAIKLREFGWFIDSYTNGFSHFV